jgi:hypothetical protein
MIPRRTFITGLAAAIAAPYVVRDSGMLMPVKKRILPMLWIPTVPGRLFSAQEALRELGDESLGDPLLDIAAQWVKEMSAKPSFWMPA